MNVAIIADIHANKPALEAVEADMPEVDHIVCAGDVVGYNPWPAFCIEWMRDRDIPTVMGNHDQAVAWGDVSSFNDMAKEGIQYAGDHISDEQQNWLASLPTERLLFDDRVKVVHDHPRKPNYYTFPHDFGPDLLGDEDVLILGHTHVQHLEQYEEGIVLNPGSVGQPRDGDPGAAYAILDLDTMDVDLRRVEYEVGNVMDAVDDAGLPRQIGTRLCRGQ